MARTSPLLTGQDGNLNIRVGNPATARRVHLPAAIRRRKGHTVQTLCGRVGRWIEIEPWDPFEMCKQCAARHIQLTGHPKDVPGTKLLLLTLQGQRCAVCRVPLYIDGPRMRGPNRAQLDHDHATDLVRGVLCPGCNCKEWAPRREDKPKFDAYRKTPPALRFGLTVRHGRGRVCHNCMLATHQHTGT